jgi:hypothetical protein
LSKGPARETVLVVGGLSWGIVRSSPDAPHLLQLTGSASVHIVLEYRRTKSPDVKCLLSLASKERAFLF